MSNMELLYNELTARYEEYKTKDTLESAIKRTELVQIIARVQDLLILELQDQVAKLKK